MPFDITVNEVAPGIELLKPENWVTRLLGRIGGYPYSVMYVIDKEIVVDTTFPWARRALRRHLETSGLADSVKAIVITHEHEDHFGNNDMFAEVTGAPVYAHRNALAEMSYPFDNKWYRSFLFGPVLASTAKEAPASLTTAARTVELIATPGHTPGHVVVYDRESRTMVSGDLFLDAELDSQLADADGPSWLASIEAIEDVPIDVMLDGHGLVLTGDDVGRSLRAKSAYLRSLRDAVAAEMERGPRSVQAITKSLSQRAAVDRATSGEGRMSMLTGNDFSRSNLVRTFVADLIGSSPVELPGDGARRDRLDSLRS